MKIANLLKMFILIYKGEYEMAAFIVTLFVVGTIIVPLALGIKTLINENGFWKRQNYMSKIDKKF